jgi:hypothetical protein
MNECGRQSWCGLAIGAKLSITTIKAFAFCAASQRILQLEKSILPQINPERKTISSFS